MLKDDVSTIDVPECPKTFKKSRVVRSFFVSATCVPEDTDSRNPASLRIRMAWQRSYRTADESKEITSIHQLYLDRVVLDSEHRRKQTLILGQQPAAEAGETVPKPAPLTARSGSDLHARKCCAEGTRRARHQRRLALHDQDGKRGDRDGD